jgi:hypothetical protein
MYTQQPLPQAELLRKPYPKQRWRRRIRCRAQPSAAAALHLLQGGVVLSLDRQVGDFAQADVLIDEACKAVNAAFDAMSTWRIERAKNREKNSEQVIENLGQAPNKRGHSLRSCVHMD